MMLEFALVQSALSNSNQLYEYFLIQIGNSVVIDCFQYLPGAFVKRFTVLVWPLLHVGVYLIKLLSDKERSIVIIIFQEK